MPSSLLAVLIGGLLLLACAVLTVSLTPARRRDRALRKTIRQISRDTLHDLVVPDGVDGEILIDSLLLTPHGLLVLEVKRADGAIFGGERLDNWTAISKDKRVTFANPVALLQRRVIALQTLYKNVPVSGRVVFVGDAQLGSDLPNVVTDVAGLRQEFAATKSHSENALVDAFYPHWDELRRLSTV